MAALDYIVGTFERTTSVEAVEPHILAWLKSGKPTALYGYRGMTHEGVTYAVSMDGKRSLVAGTGSAAHDAAVLIRSHATEGLSIARLDVQETVVVDNPDRTIAFLTPRKVYKATRISAVNEPGETLYVGSPQSRARLRIYNKTAESGLKCENGEYLRIEVQLRDSYADQAYNAWLDNRTHEVLSYWIGKMLDEGSARDALNLCRVLGVESLGLPELDDKDWISRRMAWFESSVVPAMARLFLARPDYLETAVRLLTRTSRQGDNGTDGYDSD